MTEEFTMDKVIPGYVRKLKFKSDPFHLNPEDKHFYVNSTLKQRLDFLNRLVKSDDFLILVIGEDGSGKTTLLNHYLSKASDKWRSCRISASKGPDTKEKFENLTNHPAFILQNEELPVIMLDNAHSLTVDELEFLIDLAGRTGNSKLKRVVLFCEPQIQLKISDLAKRIAEESTINKIFIPQLSQSDTEEYINQRLKIAGYRGKNLFSSGDIKKIFKNSGGLPRKINEEAGFLLEKKTRGGFFEKFRNTGLVAASFLIAAVISVILMKSGAVEDTGITVNIEKQLVNQVQNEEKKNLFQKEEKHNTDKIEENTKKEEEKKVEKKVAEIPEDIPRVKPAEKKVEKKIAVANKGVVKRSKFRNIKKEKWLLSQKPSYYTVQILGVRKKESLFNFVKKYKINDFAFFHTSFKNRDWYPLLYGIYPTLKEANSAIKNLPAEIKLYSPWVRQMSSVQRAIKTKKISSNIVRSYAYNSRSAWLNN